MSPEDAYGTQKRLAFASGTIAALRPASVLDLGCGTGLQLTWPLALAHPETRFLGIDADERSIEYASATCVAPNLSFATLAQLRSGEQFDLIIASEVIEHVESPAAFLRDLAARLAPRGRILLTLPNGYGPYELASLLENLLVLSGLFSLLRSAKRALVGATTAAQPPADTYAVSPHVNFFSWRGIHRTIGAAALQVFGYRARTLLCGFGFDMAIRSEAARRWNARVADRLPPQFASDWMFVLEPAPGAREGEEYRRGPFARLRRRLNEKRWGLR
jgi:SAM-dependent methyltransferase